MAINTQEIAPGLVELPDGGTAAFLSANLELTTKEAAVFVRVLYADGRSVFGVVKPKRPAPVVRIKP